jgi:hypothetical protein
LSNVTRFLSFVSATKIASSFAGSVALGFSLTLDGASAGGTRSPLRVTRPGDVRIFHDLHPSDRHWASRQIEGSRAFAM